MKIRPLLTLLYVYFASSPMLMPFAVERLALSQPFNDYVYIGFSIFGLGCMTLILGGGIKYNALKMTSESRLRLLTIAPQLIMFLIFIGRVEPEKYLFDYVLIIGAYCLAVTSLIWTCSVTEHQYIATSNTNQNSAELILKPNKLFMKALAFVVLSALITWLLTLAFDYDKNLPNNLTVFGVLLTVFVLFEHRFSNHVEAKN